MNKRKTNKFFLKEDLATELIGKLNIENFENVIEPSAGDGSFSRNIDGCIAIDIEPQHESIKQMNFFDFEFDGDPEKTLVIGGPPFGYKGIMALNFFKKTTTIADTIAFIMPEYFLKGRSMWNRIPDSYYLLEQEKIPENSFLVNGEERDPPIDCFFQVWKRKKDN